LPVRLAPSGRLDLAPSGTRPICVGASAPSKTYVARLETNLETALTGAEFDVIGHGLSGEVAQGAADRMKREVEDAKPDLVIWQVGTNDALRHVAIDGFKNCLKKTLVWLKEQNVDVILINSQYSDTLVQDPFYENVVAATGLEVIRDPRRRGTRRCAPPLPHPAARWPKARPREFCLARSKAR
jgi:lysophospholipase L1-like esterase